MEHSRDKEHTPREKHVAVTCPSCGGSIKGNYCPVCGEKKLEKHDFALKHYLEASLEGFTHLDNKFLHTLKLLVTKPGILTIYFSAGKRVDYVKPFQLFLICNLLYFLLTGPTNFFFTPLSSFYNYEPYIWFNTKEIILSKMANVREFNNLEVLFNEKIGTYSKLFIVLFIVVFSVAFSVLFRKRNKFASEHLVFATHFFSFILLFYTVFTLLVTKPFYRFSGLIVSDRFDLISGMTGLVVVMYYFVVATRRYYKTGIIYTLFCTLMICVLFAVTLQSYRLLLFFKVITSISLPH